MNSESILHKSYGLSYYSNISTVYECLFYLPRPSKPVIVESFTNRSRLGIIFQVLSLCSNGSISQTQLMNKANLSYFQLKKYMKTMVAKKLLHQVNGDDRIIFTITDKGRQYVEVFQELSLLLIDRKSIYTRY